MLDSVALTKLQSLLLVILVIVSIVSGSIAYLLLNQDQSSSTIKIGVFADLDGPNGKHALQGVILAAEQLNAQGGILGKPVEVVGEDHDGESGIDIILIESALNRLITYHKVDFIIGHIVGEAVIVSQDIAAEHKKILIQTGDGSLEYTQRVLDNYDKYKYFFRVSENATSSMRGITDCLSLMREITGFNKIGYLAADLGWTRGIMQGLDNFLPENGFEIVYSASFPANTIDFSSYFAAAETTGIEVLVPLISGDEGIPFIKEYYDRQSPIFVYGGLISIANRPESWDWTDGKCNNIATAGQPIVAGYPITSKTLATKTAYKDRWESDITGTAAATYDTLRFILSDAIERAGTIETDAVIEALEKTSIETSKARNWVFTSSHDVMVGENVHDPDADYQLVMIFQWQNGTLVPVYPKKIMEEAGATLTFPDWPGPWD